MDSSPVQSDKVYGWDRYSCPPDAKVMLDPLGYVLDPEGDERSQALNANPFRFESIDHLQCLVLLGGPIHEYEAA